VRKPKIVGIDISLMAFPGSGVGTYTYNLVKHLPKSDLFNFHLFYSSLRRPPDQLPLKSLQKNEKKIFNYHFPRRLIEFFGNRLPVLPVELLIGKLDLFHSSDFLRFPLIWGKGVTTVHDLTWKKFPEYHTQEIIKLHQKKMELTIKHGDFIIVDSEATKKDLFEYYPQIDPKKVFKVYLGVDELFFKKANINASHTLAQYQINSPYILYVGAIEPRKNLKTLISAYHQLISTNPQCQNIKLVIGGKMGWKNEDVYQLVKILKLKDKVIFTGYIKQNDLPTLYQNAKVFVMPSFYEGFGLPVLEAMASNCPVISSSSSSLPEAGGKFPTYFNPSRVSELTRSLEKVLSFTIKEQESLTKAAYSWARKFTWTNTAKQTLAVYQKALDTP